MNHHAQPIEDHVARIAAALGETNNGPIHQIRLILKIMGPAFADEILQETEAIEAQGGLMLERENRRRTKGGVFFHLTRQRVPKRTRFKIFALPTQRGRNAQAQGPIEGQPPQSTPRQQVVPLSVEALPEVIQALEGAYGKASTVKITLIGQPTQVVERGDIVILGLISDKLPTFPKGIPVPPAQTKYVVLIAKKQWAKVAEQIKAQDDMLIIEGYPAYAPQHAGITVYTLSVTTKQLEIVKREMKREASREVQSPSAPQHQ